MPLSYDKLTKEQLESELTTVPAWSLVDGAIHRLFEFKSYQEGLVFAVAAGWEAERLNHHPDLVVGYQRVQVVLSTHDASGLTSYDFELARRIDRLV